MKDFIELTDKDQIKAYLNPYRLDILNTFRELNKPLTAKLVADHLGEVPAKVHYHVRKLVDNNILKLVYTKEVNGIIAKYYEPTAIEFKVSGKKMPQTTKTIVKNNLVNLMNREWDKFKDIFNKTLTIKKNTKVKAYFSFTSEEVYLTKDQIEEINDYINNIVKNNDKNLKSDDNRKTYHLFHSLTSKLDENE